MSSSSLHTIAPSTFRISLRQGKFKQNNTQFTCQGFKQANMAILPKKYAVNFAQFAEGNKGAIPVLYKSKPGEFQAPPLCDDSNILTDVPSYNKVVNGEVECQLDNLLDFDLSNYVFFYIGCSFSFSKILLKNGILTGIEKFQNVPMFLTNVDSYSAGPFKCKMVVSMRPIKKEKFSLLATLCNFLHDVHGPPISYGNPEKIGIFDVQKPDFGDPVPIGDDELPVFFCCGVTGIEALKSAKIDLSFSHSPGCMFITDVVQEENFSGLNDFANKSEVIEFNEKSACFSSLSAVALDTINKLNSVIQQDLASRNIKELIVGEDFAKAALALSHATSVALVTGFPVFLDRDPPDETDGLAGILSLASVLQSLGKDIVLFVDDYAGPLNSSIVNSLVAKTTLKSIKIIPYEDGKVPLLDSNGDPVYDVILSSERVGRSADGKYYTMRGKDVSSRVSPFDNYYYEALKCPDITTIAIGDGGNELGMGKVAEKVRQHVALGEKIACVVSSDLLITAGVSNWGCYALGLALYVLQSCPIHDRYKRRAVGFPVNVYEIMKESLPSVARERTILEVVEEHGIQDGAKPEQKMSVDGLLFDREHTDLLNQMLKIAGLPNHN